MTKRLAIRIASFIRQYDETADVEVLAYGYEIILQEVGGIVLVLLSSLLFRLFFPMLLTVTIYTVMRLCAGGAHANSHLVCDISYVTQLYGAILISQVMQDRWLHGVLFALGVLLLLMYAPGDTEQQPIVEKAKLHKIISVGIFLLFSAASVVVWQYSRLYSNILILMPTVCSAFTHPIVYRLYGCKKYRTGLFR